MKRKQSNPSQALVAISGAHEPLFALRSLGQGYIKAGEIFAVKESVRALCGVIENAYSAAYDALTVDHHSASDNLLMSSAALQALVLFVKEIEHSDEGEKDKPSKAFRAMVGAVVVSFTAEAGRWMEQAEHACGESVGCGWLDPTDVPGLDGLRYYRDPQAIWMADITRQLDQENRVKVADFAKVTLERQQQAMALVCRTPQAKA